MKARWRLPVMLLAVTALFWLLLDAREVRQAVGEEDPMQHYIRCSLSYQNQMLADIKALLERIALNTDAAEQKKG